MPRQSVGTDPLGRLRIDPDELAEQIRRAWRNGRHLDDFGEILPALSGSVGRDGGNRREDVAKVETLLSETGDMDLRKTDGPTGYAGMRLENAILNFQKRNGLKPDGYVAPGGETIRALTVETETPGAPTVSTPNKKAPENPNPDTESGKDHRKPKSEICSGERDDGEKFILEWNSASDAVKDAETRLEELPAHIERLKQKLKNLPKIAPPSVTLPRIKTKNGKPKYSPWDLLMDLSPALAERYDRKSKALEWDRGYLETEIQQAEQRLAETRAKIETLRNAKKRAAEKVDQANQRLQACYARHGH